MKALILMLLLAATLMKSGYVTSEGRDSSGYGVGSNRTESTTDGPALGSGVGREAILGSGG